MARAPSNVKPRVTFLCYTRPMRAMILAAGEGTRLRPLTASLPKPMVPLVGTPLLARTLRWLAGQGVEEVAVNLFHRPQAIPDYFGTSFEGVRLHYFFEDALRGTAGGLKAAESIFRGAPFFVIYGDNLVHADLRRLAGFHAARGGLATVGLFHHPNPAAAGIVGLDEQGRITLFVEKPPASAIFSDLANAGVYVLDPAVLDAIPPDTACDFGRDIFPRLLEDGATLHGTLLGGYLQDTGTPDAYRQANWDLLEGRAGQAFPDPALWTGSGARLGRGVVLRGRNVLGADVKIGDGASLTDCILWDGARIGAGVRLERVIAGAGVAVEATVPPGSLLAP